MYLTHCITVYATRTIMRFNTSQSVAGDISCGPGGLSGRPPNRSSAPCGGARAGLPRPLEVTERLATDTRPFPCFLGADLPSPLSSRRGNVLSWEKLRNKPEAEKEGWLGRYGARRRGRRRGRKRSKGWSKSRSKSRRTHAYTWLNTDYTHMHAHHYIYIYIYIYIIAVTLTIVIIIMVIDNVIIMASSSVTKPRNIAESSLTLPSVCGIIDLAMRRLHFSSLTLSPCLSLPPCLSLVVAPSLSLALSNSLSLSHSLTRVVGRIPLGPLGVRCCIFPDLCMPQH